MTLTPAASYTARLRLTDSMRNAGNRIKKHMQNTNVNAQMRFRASLCLIALLLQSSCSTANWYAGARASGEAECRKQPVATYEECMRNYDTSYLEYKKQREEALQK